MASLNIFKLFEGMNPITKSEPVMVRSKKDLKKFLRKNRRKYERKRYINKVV